MKKMKEFWISADLGYGQVKGVNQESKKIMFPSILAPGKDRALDMVFDDLQNNIVDNLHIRIREKDMFDAKDYFVGKLAQKRNMNSYFNTKDNKIYSNENKVFLSALTGLLLPKDIAEMKNTL